MSQTVVFKQNQTEFAHFTPIDETSVRIMVGSVVPEVPSILNPLPIEWPSDGALDAYKDQYYHAQTFMYPRISNDAPHMVISMWIAKKD
jgi:hypothetical protein